MNSRNGRKPVCTSWSRCTEEADQTTKRKQTKMQNHINPHSGYRFKGGNLLILEQAMAAHRYITPEWVTSAQAGKMGLKPMQHAKPIQVMLNETPFSLFNLEQLQPASAATMVPAQTAQLSLAM